jgi:hypothetical protein
MTWHTRDNVGKLTLAMLLLFIIQQGAKDAGCLATIYISHYGVAPPPSGPQPDHVVSSILDIPALVDSIFSEAPDLTMAPIDSHEQTPRW